VTLSLGVATIPDSAEDLDSLLDAADRALLRAKRAGKNQIRAAPANRSGRAAAEAQGEPRRRRFAPERRTHGKRP
jgi:predicted signal transduction protein with EAL and GGDEF domain